MKKINKKQTIMRHPIKWSSNRSKRKKSRKTDCFPGSLCSRRKKKSGSIGRPRYWWRNKWNWKINYLVVIIFVNYSGVVLFKLLSIFNEPIDHEFLYIFWSLFQDFCNHRLENVFQFIIHILHFIINNLNWFL